MKILCIAQVEDSTNVEQQVAKQTLQPTESVFYIDKKPARGIEKRRKRISDNHGYLRLMVRKYNPDLVWQIEGDCDLPEDCLARLVQHYHNLYDKNFGFVSGVQVGRHGLYCLGAWHFNDDRTRFNSVDYKLDGLQRVDATGFYCLLAPTDVWLSGVASYNGERYGPDVNFGLSIKKDKYVDMNLEIGHIFKGGIIRPSDISTCNATFWLENNQWSFKQLD